MSTTTICNGQPDQTANKGDKMGVASLATKRHLESPIDGDEVVSPKIAKLVVSQNNNNLTTQNNNISVENTASSQGDGSLNGDLHTSSSQNTVQDSTNSSNNTLVGINGDGGVSSNSTSTSNSNSSELVTTSILARTLLTTSSSGTSSLIGVASQYSGADPLESLKSSLEALPAPAILDSPSSSYLTSSLNKATIVQNGGDTTSNSTSLVGFASLLGPERCGPIATAVTTVLSPIDEDPIEWTNPAKATPVVNGVADHNHHGMNPSISSLTSLVDHQLQQQLQSAGGSCGGVSPHHEVITEDENGKSYFNLGSTPDSTILARKSSLSSGDGWGSGGSCAGGSQNQDFDDAISSSSCDSISSEDLFNSGEEFDASDDDDEDELCTYKQQRSTVLHLSLCKLNKFRTNCVEPSLHRSVLICNTLRHIEQEIRNEDEAAGESLKSRERLPSFWGSSPSNPPGPNQSQNNCFPPPLPGTGGAQSSQPQITDTRPGIGLGLGVPLQSPGVIPSLGGAPMLPPPSATNGGHDPYLTPNPYSEAPYLSAYDYNSPRPTPFHTTSYDYEQDLLLPPPPNASPSSTAPSQGSTSQASSILLGDVTATSSLLECDSGYSDDLDMSLSSYYYTSPLPPPVPVNVPPVTSSHPVSLPDFNSAMTGASTNPVSTPTTSSSGAIQVSSICNSSPSTTQSGDCTQNPYLPCPPPASFQQLPPQATQDPLLSSHLPVSRGEHLTQLQPPTSSSSSPMEISDMGDITEIRNQSTTSTSSSLLPSGGCGGASSSPCEYTMASSSTSLSSTTSCADSTAPSIASITDEQNESTPPPTSTSPCSSPPHLSSTSIPCSNTSTSGSTSSGGATSTPTSLANTFAQQDSQCGLESRRSDLSRNVGNHYNNHNLPMDSLISPAYSSSSL